MKTAFLLLSIIFGVGMLLAVVAESKGVYRGFRGGSVCESVSCGGGCPNSGFKSDPNGCQTCRCNNPCAEIKCINDKCTSNGDAANCDEGTA
ncbi:hypothetical protein HELRODRAFT_192441 [Helobdella robusta]|uniref:Antistasin-like domain-containing protein n=1 Tax=Helobdella robusta TaxID=6412 RepID=T1FTY8_HELRO|nr:hypothetical protein HELRODRAFT_192441 [Helobdella robusta]ESO00833.1 hypothetical protein HELRODRAFT_192441 [Helobdella robusta]